MMMLSTEYLPNQKNPVSGVDDFPDGVCLPRGAPRELPPR